MTSTSWRVLRTELLRGTAPVAALAVVAAGLPLLFNNATTWAGRWVPLAETTRLLLLVLVPLAVTAGAWQAGREHRRRLGDQLRTSARPGWQPIVVAWASVTIATSAALLLVWLAGALVVAPVASYGGRGSWSTLAVGLTALAAASALGVAVGRLVPLRVAAPLAGVVVLLTLQSVTWRLDGLRWLSPVIDPMSGTHFFGAGFHATQFGWFAGLAAALLVIVAARRRWLAVGPALVAILAGAALAAGPVDRWQPDVAAQELVCAPGDGPQVCFSQVNAFVLNDAAPLIRDRLERWHGVPGAEIGLIDAEVRDHVDCCADLTSNGFIEVWRFVTWTGGFSATTSHTGESLDEWVARAVVNSVDADGGECGYEAVRVALEWAGGNPYLWWVNDDGTPYEPEPSPHVERLMTKPLAEQKVWMGRYLEAAPTCDGDAMVALIEELS